MKTVAFFPLQCAKNAQPVVANVLQYLKSIGIQVIENSMDCDCALIWSVLWHGKMKSNQAIYHHYRTQGKPVLIIEIGALRRGQTWKVAVNNLNVHGYYGHTTNLDLDRPAKLGIKLGTQTKSGSQIVLALQHNHSHQVAPIPNVTAWISDILHKLKEHTDRLIVVRPHPRAGVALPQLPVGVSVQKPKPLSGTYDSYDMPLDCHAIVNYNSGPGIQAALAGVRPIVDSSSLAHSVSIDYTEIEKPYSIDREQWLIEICHTEYTLEELRNGSWLKRIAPALM